MPGKVSDNASPLTRYPAAGTLAPDDRRHVPLAYGRWPTPAAHALVEKADDFKPTTGTEFLQAAWTTARHKH